MVDFTISFISEDFEQQEKIFLNMKSDLIPEIIYGRDKPALINYHEALDAAPEGQETFEAVLER